MQNTRRKQEFWSGVRDEAPILLGVIPFGLLYGALAINVHLTAVEAQAMSAIIFAGASQLIAAQLIGGATSGACDPDGGLRGQPSPCPL